MTNSKGFTLIEVLIVVAIFAIGMSIAIPNLLRMGRRSAAMSDARQIKNQLSKARLIAVERNAWVTVEYRQPNDDYVVFIDSTPPDYTYDGTEEIVGIVKLKSTTYDTSEGGGDGIAIASGNSISWDSKGIAYDNGGGLPNGSIYIKGKDDSGYKVTINDSGNIRIQKN